MKIKKGDKVQVITGQDKGITGEVVAVLTRSNRVVVSGVNIRKKHEKPSQINPDGGIIEKEMPIAVSNVKLFDSKAKKTAKKDAKKTAKKTTKKGAK